MFSIENRRYVGNKFKLMDWIKENIERECINCNSLFDVFAGTGSVSNCLIEDFNTIILNDFLFSNEVIYRAFFEDEYYNIDKLLKIKDEYNSLSSQDISNNYISDNFGGKFFSLEDSLFIGYIREDLETKIKHNYITRKEFNILLASLLYSADRVANTCGHYDAYIKSKTIKSGFYFDLIQPIDTSKKNIHIFRCDSNKLASDIKADIAFIDPPYNSRQYSRFYHVLENITKWEKPELYGTALKPKAENMSDYCKSTASYAFDDLIKKLDVKYIVVTYNNTYTSKSSSSKNKITLEQILEILNTKGSTKIFEKEHKFFNAGKTNLPNHKELLFITKVGHHEK